MRCGPSSAAEAGGGGGLASLCLGGRAQGRWLALRPAMQPAPAWTGCGSAGSSSWEPVPCFVNEEWQAWHAFQWCGR